MRKTKLARTGGLLLAAILVTANLSGSAQAAETGSVTGEFTDRAGQAMANVGVALLRWDGNELVSQTTTDAAGDYSFTAISAGDYRMQFQPAGYPFQYAGQTTNASAARLIRVGNGTAEVVNDQLMPFGTFTGRLTKADGTGLASNLLYLVGTTPHSVTTDSDGYYTARTHPGNYAIRFPLPNNGTAGDSINQFIPGTDLFAAAQRFDLAAGQTITANDTVMPTGYLTGTFTREGGVPVEYTGVYISHVTTPAANLFTLADAAGSWRRRVRAGEFTVHFRQTKYFVSQYAYGKVLLQDAAHITVLDGQTVTVNDSKLATGSLRITARDSVTGLPVARFHASLNPGHGASDLNPDDGVQTISELPAATYRISVQGYGYQSATNVAQAAVTAGSQTDVELTMQPRTRIDAKIVDASTGQPVPGVCLVAGTREHFRMGGSPYEPGCYASLADGRTMVEIPEDAPGTYQLFAMPDQNRTPGLGAQWVGATGGEGSQLEAKNIVVSPGQVVNAPVVKLDHAGEITGRITGSAGPVSSGMVTLTDHTLYLNYGRFPIADDGTYTVTGLGPYAWPLRFSAADEADQYSGGKGNRHEAQRVQVTSDGRTTYDYQFRAGTRINLVAPSIDAGCSVEVFNAGSGDRLWGSWTPNCASGIDFNVVDGQKIKLHILSGSQAHWHGGNTFSSAYAVQVDHPLSITFQPGRYILPAEPAPSPVPNPLPSAPPPPPTPRPHETP